MQNEYYIFREAHTEEELKSLLSLRYQVYKESRLKDFIENNSHELDLDCYDLRSLHFGLFHINNGIQSALGYMRTVTNQFSPQKDMLLKIAVEQNENIEKLFAIPKYPMPLLEYFPDAPIIHSHYKRLKYQGKKIVEPGRFALLSKFRSRHLAQHMVISTIAIIIYNYTFNHAYMTCHVPQQRFYNLFGFDQVTDTNDYKIYGVPLVSLFWSEKYLNSFVLERIRKMAEVFKNRGCITYNPAQPNNFNLPESTFEVYKDANMVAA